MRKQKGIGIDLDGVTADTGKGLTTILSNINNRPINISEIINYNLELLGLPKYSHKKFFNKEFYMKLEPIENSREVINCLYEDNFIVLITARDHYPEVMDDTFNWLVDHGFLFDKLIQSRNKVGPMKHYELDYLIDDHFNTCYKLAKEGFDSILFEQPWNKYSTLNDESEYKHIKRLKNWKDVAYFVGQCQGKLE